MLGASAHAVPAVAYTARPASSARRRPRRSESGPQTSCAAARPARKRVTVSCAVAASEPKASVMAGSDGRNMSIDSAPRPTITVSSTGRTSERSRATPAHCIVGAPEGGAREGLRRAARHVFVGGGLGGPLRSLPQISIAPAKPALAARPQSGAGDMTTAFPLRNACPFAGLKGLAAEIQKIRSMEIVSEISEELRLACGLVGNVELYEYNLAVSLKRV